MNPVIPNATSEGSYTMGRSPSQPTIDVRSPQAGAAVVVLGGEHDLYSADRLRQTFDDLLFGNERLIVDLSSAEFIDSTIVGVLVQTTKRADGRDRKFTVVLGKAGVVERILEITGVRRVLNVVPTVERALAA
jgi:anti-sigma B factor antagonist